MSTGQEGLYDALTGYDVCRPTGRTTVEVTEELIAAGSFGFDPIPSLEAMTQKGLWVFTDLYLIGIVPDKGAGGTEVNDFGGFGNRIGKGVHVGHHVMPEFLFVFF